MNKDKVDTMQCPKCGVNAIITIEDSKNKMY